MVRGYELGREDREFNPRLGNFFLVISLHALNVKYCNHHQWCTKLQVILVHVVQFLVTKFIGF